MAPGQPDLKAGNPVMSGVWMQMNFVSSQLKPFYDFVFKVFSSVYMDILLMEIKILKAPQ